MYDAVHVIATADFPDDGGRLGLHGGSDPPRSARTAPMVGTQPLVPVAFEHVHRENCAS